MFSELATATPFFSPSKAPLIHLSRLSSWALELLWSRLVSLTYRQSKINIMVRVPTPNPSVIIIHNFKWYIFFIQYMKYLLRIPCQTELSLCKFMLNMNYLYGLLQVTCPFYIIFAKHLICAHLRIDSRVWHEAWL